MDERVKQVISLIPSSIIKKHKEQEELRIWRVSSHHDFNELHEKKIKIGERFGKLGINPRIRNIAGFPVNGAVVLVDGNMVRSKIDIDFTCGGHGYRYVYIPFNEVWIDNGLKKKDRVPTMWHELVEFRLMQNGMNYNDAHDIAAQVEMMIREGKATTELLEIFR
jgi:hypothetical protein